MLPLVVTLESSAGQVRRYAFADSPVSIGRSPFADFQLSESFVSRWEGTLRFDADEITYFSLGSTNPTFVNGRQIAAGEDTVLPPGAVVTLGELTLRFSREPVPESDLRRKGKPKPVQEGGETSLKTAYLDAPLRRSVSSDEPSADPPSPSRETAAPSQPPLPAPSQAPPAVPSQSLPPYPSHLPASPQPVERRPSQAPEARGDVLLLRRVTVTGVAAPQSSAPPHGAPRAPISSVPPSPAPRPSFHPPTSEPEPSWPSARGEHRPSHSPHVEPSTESLHSDYRAASSALLSRVTRELEQLPIDRRAAYLEDLQRRNPHFARDPELQAVLKRHGLATRRSEVPEVGEWLADIARDVLPARMKLDTGVTLDRILGLLETLTQSLGEINDAQNTVRQRWLGRQPKQSVLRSENGRAILAYLLNPQADWNERLLELEQTIRQAVTHELALFQATIEGARLLIHTVSPQSIANAEGIDLEQLETGTRGGLWSRLRTKESPEAVLWNGFVNAYETLIDSDRYQRVFLGRAFAKTYLAAMGQAERSVRRDG